MRFSLPLAFLLLPLLSISPAFGQVSVTNRVSFVNAGDFALYGPGAYDAQSLNGLGNFNATAMSPTPSGIDIITSQNSTVTNTIFEIETFSDSATATDFTSESITELLVEFDVALPVTYLLEGTFTEEITDYDQAFAGVSLSEPGFGTPPFFSIGSSPNSTTNFSESGVLPAGSYVFDFNSTNLGAPAVRGAVLSSDLSITFTTIAVPEPSALTLFCGLMAALATRRKRA